MQRHALQFEWAWQHPEKSHLCRPIYEQWSQRGLRAADAQVHDCRCVSPYLSDAFFAFADVWLRFMQVKLAAEMLSLKPFSMYPLTVQVLSVKFADLWKGAPGYQMCCTWRAYFMYSCTAQVPGSGGEHIWSAKFSTGCCIEMQRRLPIAVTLAKSEDVTSVFCADTRPLPPHITIHYAPLKDVPITVPLTFVDEPNDSSSTDCDSSCSLSVTAQEDTSAGISSHRNHANVGVSAIHCNFCSTLSGIFTGV